MPKILAAVLLFGTALAVLAACEKKRPPPSTVPCVTAIFRVFDLVKAGEMASPEARGAAACSELYRHAACGDAWKRELTSGVPPTDAGIRPAEGLPDPARIASACAKAYCAELQSKPKLCSAPPPSENEALVAALGELDAEILSHELGDRNLGTGLAVRTTFFRVHSMRMEVPTLPMAANESEPVLGVDIAADESIVLDGRAVAAGDFEKALGKLGALAEQRAVIRADRRVSHGRVIEVLDALKRAGVKKIAFGVVPKEVPQPAVSGSQTTR